MSKKRLAHDYGVSEEQFSLIASDIDEQLAVIRAAALDQPFPESKDRGREFR
jgi:hypothetical protein